MGSTVALEGLAAQRRLIEKLEKDHFGWDIIVGDARGHEQSGCSAPDPGSPP